MYAIPPINKAKEILLACRLTASTNKSLAHTFSIKINLDINQVRKNLSFDSGAFLRLVL